MNFGSMGFTAIGTVSRLTGIHQQTIRHYERLGLVHPLRSEGGTRYFAPGDIQRLLVITSLTQDLGVNLAGVELILRQRDREARLVRMLSRVLDSVDPETRARVRDELFDRSEPGLVKVDRARLAVFTEKITEEIYDRGK